MNILSEKLGSLTLVLFLALSLLIGCGGSGSSASNGIEVTTSATPVHFQDAHLTQEEGKTYLHFGKNAINQTSSSNYVAKSVSSSTVQGEARLTKHLWNNVDETIIYISNTNGGYIEWYQDLIYNNQYTIHLEGYIDGELVLKSKNEYNSFIFGPEYDERSIQVYSTIVEYTEEVLIPFTVLNIKNSLTGDYLDLNNVEEGTLVTLKIQEEYIFETSDKKFLLPFYYSNVVNYYNSELDIVPMGNVSSITYGGTTLLYPHEILENGLHLVYDSFTETNINTCFFFDVERASRLVFENVSNPEVMVFVRGNESHFYGHGDFLSVARYTACFNNSLTLDAIISISPINYEVEILVDVFETEEDAETYDFSYLPAGKYVVSTDGNSENGTFDSVVYINRTYYDDTDYRNQDIYLGEVIYYYHDGESPFDVFIRGFSGGYGSTQFRIEDISSYFDEVL